MQLVLERSSIDNSLTINISLINTTQFSYQVFTILIFSQIAPSRPKLIVHSNLPIIQILCSHISSLLFK